MDVRWYLSVKTFIVPNRDPQTKTYWSSNRKKLRNLGLNQGRQFWESPDQDQMPFRKPDRLLPGPDISTSPVQVKLSTPEIFLKLEFWGWMKWMFWGNQNRWSHGWNWTALKWRSVDPRYLSFRMPHIQFIYFKWWINGIIQGVESRIVSAKMVKAH